MILAGWDVLNAGTSDDPLVTIFPYSEVDFAQFKEAAAVYEKNAVALSAAATLVSLMALAF